MPKGNTQRYVRNAMVTQRGADEEGKFRSWSTTFCLIAHLAVRVLLIEGACGVLIKMGGAAADSAPELKRRKRGEKKKERKGRKMGEKERDPKGLL